MTQQSSKSDSSAHVEDRVHASGKASNESPEQLHEELVSGSPGSDYDRSLTRESDFGGGFGQGHYTGTSWDPEMREEPHLSSSDSEDEDEDVRAPRTHPINETGSAGAGKFGGVANPGLTTGGSSKHSS
ncbi:MAG: hypothetical protein ACJ8MR_01350 [Povalibacter sp.]